MRTLETVFTPDEDAIVVGRPGSGKTQYVALPAFAGWRGPALLLSDEAQVAMKALQYGLDPMLVRHPIAFTPERKVIISGRSFVAHWELHATVAVALVSAIASYTRTSVVTPLVILEGEWSTSRPVLDAFLALPKDAVRLVVVTQSLKMVSDLAGADTLAALQARCATRIDANRASEGCTLVERRRGDRIYTEVAAYTPFFALEGRQ